MLYRVWKICHTRFFVSAASLLCLGVSARARTYVDGLRRLLLRLV